jgi:hypothetical protein
MAPTWVFISWALVALGVAATIALIAWIARTQRGRR